MDAKAWHYRNHIKHIDGAWVRVYRDGSVWAGAGKDRGREGMDEIKVALEAAGFICRCHGRPGTAGEFIVSVELIGEDA